LKQQQVKTIGYGIGGSTARQWAQYTRNIENSIKSNNGQKIVEYWWK
jgi:hypothetical protein